MPRPIRCIACNTSVKLEGALCKSCNDVVRDVERMIRTERQEKKFLRFLESDYHLSIFLDDDDQDV